MKTNPYIKNSTGIVLIIITIIITLIFLFDHLSNKSFYPESGSVKVSGIKENVNIYRDDFGVSHIEANNEDDLYFALGYTHAQDRLWQMDLYRRIAEGKMSEIFGKDVIEYDKLFRTIGINKIAYQFYTNLSPKSKDILKNYSDGVNYFINSHIKKLPLEFDVLNYKPEIWKPEHSVMLIRLLGWELNLSWYTDFMFGEIVKKYGFEKAKDFFPNYPEDAPFIIPAEKKSNENLKLSDSTKKISELKIEDGYKKLVDLGCDFFKTNLDFRNILGIKGTHIGSNSWVISGKKSENKKPILANDPHLVLQSPSKWYEVELINKSDNFFFGGFSIPGVPGVAIGYNNVISWGITNLMNDDADFYILKRDSTNHNKYIYKDISYTIDSTTESIKIKDVKDEVYFTVYHTKLGPVISNLSKTGFMDNKGFKTNSNELLTFRWTGFDFSDEIECFYELDNSRNWNEFKNALKNYNLPASNFVYADTMGNIGYHAAGKIPVRKNLTNDDFAMYPSNGEIEWTSYLEFDDLPQSFNPKEEYIVTANNKPQKDYKHYISNLYEPPYRAERIEQILKLRNNFTANEFKLIQNDVNSLQAKEFCSYIFEAFKDSLSLNPEEKDFLNLLKKWDYEMKLYSPAATVFAEFEIMLYKNIYKDKLGNDLFDNYIFLKNIPVRNTSKLLKEPNSWMFDILGNGGKPENRNDIIKKSFRETIYNLRQKYHNNDLTKWYWGEIHKVIINHPLGTVTALSQVLNIGPYEIGGNGTTVANSEYSFSSSIEKNEFESFLGPSMRFIIDMANVSSYQSILPTGQSGQPHHRHYKDQTRFWLNGEYKTVITKDYSNVRDKLTLIPVK
jgi:penicillin G amidase